MRKVLNFVKLGNIGLVVSIITVIVVIVLWSLWGLKLGIDFTGGSLLEVKFLGERTSNQAVSEKLTSLGFNNAVVQPLGDQGMLIRLGMINEEQHQQLLSGIREAATGVEVQEERFESIGPTVGAELTRNAFYTVALVLIAIIVYIAWAFRKVSKPVSSWKFGLSAILALFHDVLVVVGLFIILGKFMDVRIDTGFVAAILTVLGYSVNDTVVIFDRIRENLTKRMGSLSELVNYSINETLARSINTTLTTSLALIPIFLFGGETIKFFSLALVIGIITGAYSSIFIASPLLLIWEKLKRK